jgi:aminoacrylate hydrolase
MPTILSDDVSIHYEIVGSGSPVVLLAGLVGIGRAWGPQIELFAKNHLVILPDQRGTGQSEKTVRGQIIEQHAADVATLIRSLMLGPVHLIGSSTGGAIAQVLAIDHPELIRSAVIASSFARPDAFFRRQFVMRRRLIEDSGWPAAVEANALFLFDPVFHRQHPEGIAAWERMALAAPFDQDIAFARFDMLNAHDQLDRLSRVRCPVLVLVGNRDFCTPVYFSEEIANRTPGALLEEIEGGHFIFLERPENFHAHVERFIAQHEA